MTQAAGQGIFGTYSVSIDLWGIPQPQEEESPNSKVENAVPTGKRISHS